MAGTKWHYNYEKHREDVLALREQYHARCKELGADPRRINDGVWLEMVVRIVHESNWQEDLYLDTGRTKELAEAVFDDPLGITGPRLDMSGLVTTHKEKVIQLIREKKSKEEIAAYNLFRAHEAIKWIGVDVWMRQIAAMFVLVRELEVLLDQVPGTEEEKAERRASLARIKDATSPVIDKMCSNDQQLEYPFQGGLLTAGKWISGLLAMEYEKLSAPMTVDHLHFLHRLTMMGLLASAKCGTFRKKHVHVSGNYDLMFPPPDVVPSRMEEFCDDFGLVPTIHDLAKRSASGTLDAQTFFDTPDRIKEAARLSHRFVRIHPYADGNGRMSRIVMNMVLWFVHPPVYLKADKKGRHRYGWALRKADRGDINPLACLIAISLKMTYKRLLASVTPPTGTSPA